MDDSVGFILNDGLIHWGHRGQQIKDSSCASQWNTLQNNDNSDGREQAVHWLDTKATKWSISSCYHCLIVPICWFQRTEECVCMFVCLQMLIQSHLLCSLYTSIDIHLYLCLCAHINITYASSKRISNILLCEQQTVGESVAPFRARWPRRDDEAYLTSLQCQSCTF